MARDTGRVTDRTSSRTDDVVRDPVSGRPLHEFVVDPLGAPTTISTEGDPIDESGVQQAPHGEPRKKPVMVVTLDTDALDDDAIEAFLDLLLGDA